MPPDREQARLAEVQRLTRHKSGAAPVGQAIGPELIHFFKQSVQKRQGKFEKIADCWARLVPPMLSDHCALESFSRGTLIVLVDSSSHLYELRQLLLSGLEKQLIVACKTAGLKKVTLRAGRWYHGDDVEKAKLSFD